MARMKKNTQTSYAVIGVFSIDSQLHEVEGTTYATEAEAILDASKNGSDVMVRENRIVWLSPSLEVKLLDRKVKRDIAGRGRPQEDRV